MHKILTRLISSLVVLGALALAPFAAGMASAAPGMPAYGPAGCTVTVTITPAPPLARGEHFTITIRGTCDHVDFTVQIHSITDTLGTMTTDGSGNATASFTVPTDLPDGNHTVTVSSSVGSSASQGVVVSGGPYTGAGSSRGPSSSSGLPLTGADVATGAGIGAIAILVGGLLVLSVRRRRMASPS